MWMCLKMWVPENCYNDQSFKIWFSGTPIGPQFYTLKRRTNHVTFQTLKDYGSVPSTSNPKLAELPTEPEGHRLLSCKEVQAGHVLSSVHEDQHHYDIQEL